MKLIQNEEKQFSIDFQSEKQSLKKFVLVEKTYQNLSKIVRYWLQEAKTQQKKRYLKWFLGRKVMQIMKIAIK